MLHDPSSQIQSYFQVARISTVAEEALSNIRTVRAFGMEEKECELLEEEAYKAQELNEKLGLGIGLFMVNFSFYFVPQ